MPESIGTLIVIAVIAVAILVVIVGLYVLFKKQYQKVAPNTALVVFGRGEKPEIIQGGGRFVWPVVEDFKRLQLQPHVIRQEDDVMTDKGIPIKVRWLAQIAVDTEGTALNTAAQRVLEMEEDEIIQTFTEQLSTNVRSIASQMSVEDLHGDRDAFTEKVQNEVGPEMAKLGFKILYMGIEDLRDTQGYFEEMAKPQIAENKKKAAIAEAVAKRDSDIATAEAQREARVKAAADLQTAEQAELDARTKVLEQKQALDLREVEVKKQVGLANADSEAEVQTRRATAEERRQEAEVLVPARADKQATLIRAEAERERVVVEAEGESDATVKRAEADALARERRAAADLIEKQSAATAHQAHEEAEAAGQKAHALAEADGTRAKLNATAEGNRAVLMAEAEGTEAKLLAEAKGKREIADAAAAQDEINLRQFIVEVTANAEVEKIRAIAEAVAGLGGNVRIVDFGGGANHNGSGNSLMGLLTQIPGIVEMLAAQGDALGGDSKAIIDRVLGALAANKGSSTKTPVQTTATED